MPLFDYKCDTCEYLEENKLSSFADSEQLKECPNCKTLTVRKLTSTPGGFILIGDGFYKPTRR